jgi:cytosine/adenosine deaminase-related metal-dependent hydrolase
VGTPHTPNTLTTNPQAGMRGLSGSWLLVGDGTTPPIAAGAVVLDATERVLAVGDLASLQGRFPSLRFEAVSGVLMPGLVNAHTHLELSALRGRVPGGRGFVPWVDGLVKLRAQHKPEDDGEAIDSGVSELLAAGVVAVGEVCNRLASVAALAAVPLAAAVFHEVFGLRKDVAEVTLSMAEAERAQYTPWPGHVRYALAPHTPYTLHPAVLQMILQRVRATGGRTSLHLAEHSAERAFLETGAGAFADWLRLRNATQHDWPVPACDAIQFADRLGALAPDVIAVHLTDARPEELALVAERKSPVVLCPRSNLHIELKLPPLLDILRAGIRPGLGTDSLASNASLDPLAEARALRKRFPTVAPLELIAMATGWGADALGFAAWLGRLQPDLYPGVLAFMHGPARPSDPARFVLDHDPGERRMLSRPVYVRLVS